MKKSTRYAQSPKRKIVSKVNRAALEAQPVDGQSAIRTAIIGDGRASATVD